MSYHHIPVPTYSDPSWRDLALCTFFPEIDFVTPGEDADRAMEICRGSAEELPCPVINDCLSYALSLGAADLEGSIWAGTRYETRKRLRRERRAG